MKHVFRALAALLLVCGVAQAEEQHSAPEDAAHVRPLLMGADVPDVELTTMDGKSVALRSLVEQKPAVLVFYRGGWCPYCTTHLADMAKIESKLSEMGYQILAVSPDKPQKLKETKGDSDFEYDLYSDADMEAAKAFGIAFKVDDATIEKYEEYGIDLTEASGEDHHMLPVPAVFLVSQEGVVEFKYVNPDYRTRLNGDVLLAAAKSAVQEDHES
jgi:peroxiredoxin